MLISVEEIKRVNKDLFLKRLLVIDGFRTQENIIEKKIVKK